MFRNMVARITSAARMVSVESPVHRWRPELIVPAAPMTSLVFPVHRCKPELVAPARPTPRELKKLSDIDDQGALRFHVDLAFFYRCEPSMKGRDPVRIIRSALSQALEFYYPFAGRLREGPSRKLSVDCTGEGVLFVEADADVEFNQFADTPKPPYPCFEELLYDVPGYGGILDSPLLHFQVTRLKCTGFIFAIRLNHTVADGFGLFQYLNAMCELARGARVPSISPVWRRELLNARDPPRVTCKHYEYDKNTGPVNPFKAQDDIVERSFFFGSSEMSAILRFLPNNLNNYTKFEILTAFLWRCRIKALEIDPEDEVRLHFTVNIRGMVDSPVPTGYYGNAFAVPTVVTTAGKLCHNPLEYAIKLVKEAKVSVTKEYIQSVADSLVIKGRPYLSMKNSCIVSDTTQLGLDELDFGWGKPSFGGVAKTGDGLFSFYMKSRNEKGEIGRLVSIGLPARAMDSFVNDLDNILGH